MSLKPMGLSLDDAPAPRADLRKSPDQIEAEKARNAEDATRLKALGRSIGAHPAAAHDPAPSTPAPPPAERVIRDNFSFPRADYDLIEEMRLRAIALGLSHIPNKSELLRAGLRLLKATIDADFTQAVADLPVLKPGGGRRKV